MTLKKVGVLGGGRMGAGIAHAFLMSGAEVVVVDVNPEPALERITRDVEKSISRGATGAAADYLDGLSCVSDTAEFRGCELVIEAIPENFQLKVEAFASIAEAAPDVVIASNTSSLSISDLALTVPHPGRVIGLHFFNPVPASTLVEIVVAESTAPELVEQARRWVSELGKTPIVVKDSPGFASSRLGVVIALEAIRMVEEGVATPEDIDTAMVLGYKFPVGPLALTDIVGLDVRLGIAEYLASTLGERFEPPALMREMVERGELGRKSGGGFYEY